VDDTAATVVGQWVHSKFSPNHVDKGYLHDEKTGKGEKSVTWTPDLPQGGTYEVRIAFAGSSGRDTAVPVTIRHAEGETTLKIDQSKVPPIRQTFLSLGSFRFEAGKQGSVMLSNMGTTGYVIADAVQFVPQTESAADNTAQDAGSPDKKSTDRLAELKASETTLAEAVKTLAAEMKTLEAQAPKPPTVMAPREAPEIGDCQVCIRGEVRQRGKTIPRGFLQVVSDGPTQIQKKDESGRRELADWIARADHPLTSRVMVNRIWQHLLGEGLVRTVDNFGHLGEKPTHPELLDTLATKFVEQGWSAKKLIRQIALTRTYGLSGKLDEAAFLADPENRLLWRANRKVLPAEALRDSLLQFAGQLDYSPGESPVANMGRLAIDNNKQDASDVKTDTLRRSLYLPIVRNELPGFLTLFDFADPDLVTGQRPTTNVPSQSLYLLNSPFIKELAARIAKNLLEQEQSETTRTEKAFQLVLNRAPRASEQEQTQAFLAEIMGEEETKRPAAWTQFVQCLIASTEFRTLD